MPLKGRKQSIEHRKKISKALSGKITSEKVRNKISITMTGRKLTKKHKENIKLHSPKGIEHKKWKGDSVGKVSVHKWIERCKGVPKLCENYGTTKAKKYEWANKDHSYKRILEDYLRLCTSCHRNYDIKNNNYQK